MANFASAFFKFSTDDLPESARADVVRELHERATLSSRGPSRSSRCGDILSVSTSPNERCLG
jgi:hypothetical protein